MVYEGVFIEWSDVEGGKTLGNSHLDLDDSRRLSRERPT